MAIFQDVPIGWKDKDYVIPADRVLKAIACIEEVITLREIIVYGQRNTMPMAKVAEAYGAALRFAGADVTDAEVYEGMFSGGDVQAAVMDAVNGLLTMMLPVSQQDGPAGEADHNRGNSSKGQAPSSRKRTKRRSARAG